MNTRRRSVTLICHALEKHLLTYLPTYLFTYYTLLQKCVNYILFGLFLLISFLPRCM